MELFHNMKLGWLMLIVMFLTMITFATSSTTRIGTSRDPILRSGFAEACNKTLRCKSQAWLVCDQDERCGCAKPDEMIYEASREKCVSLIGERCKFGFGTGDDNSGLFFEKAECVSGAICGISDGICSCPFGTYEAVDDNICAPVKPFSADCLSNPECDQSISLLCLDGKCQCASDDLTFDGSEKVCKIKAGRNCIPPYKNIPKLLGAQALICVNGSQCMTNSTGICTCNLGMYMNSTTGTCHPVKPIGANCITSEECDRSQMFGCVNNVCVCDHSKSTYTDSAYLTTASSVYNNRRFTVPANICVVKVGVACSEPKFNGYYDNYAPTIGGKYCTKNAVCNQGSCSCSSGYVPTSDKLCGLAYQRECSTTNFCSDTFRCTAENTALCKCPSEELQTYENNVCKGLVGGPCDPNSLHSHGCIANAKCTESKGAEGVFICECENGYLENRNRTCNYRAFSFSCPTKPQDWTVCDGKAGLKCRAELPDSDFRCTCPNQHDTFEEDLRKCSRAVGFMCVNNEECVRNAVCEKRWDDSNGRCICETGYKFDKRGKRCVLIEVNTTLKEDKSRDVVDPNFQADLEVKDQAVISEHEG